MLPSTTSPFGTYTAYAARTRPLVVFAHKGHDWIRGSEQCLLDLVAGLDRSVFRLLVLTNGRALAAEVERRGVEAVRVAHWSGGAIVNAFTHQRVTRLLRDRAASLVHANMAVTLPLVIPTARRLGIPVLTHLHTPFSSLHDRHGALVQQSDLTVGVAEHVVAPMRAGSSTRPRVRVVHNAVNTERLAGGDARGLRGTLGIAATAFVATSVGSLIERKGQRTTVQAVARARASGTDLHLLVCGDGADEAELRALSVSLEVQHAVHFLGMRTDVGAILRDATDVLVSSASEEAQPLSVLEAQWLGVPVVASDIVAHRQAMPGVTQGVLFPLGDPDALARELVALAAQSGRRYAMARAGQAFAREHYNMRRYVRNFESLYGELLSATAVERARLKPRRGTRPAWHAVLRPS
ncbi:MAG TPA: glycosyltransferase family 4 protein [Gemmatimonadaceae bacterium]|nr:glycosyltransferase family 4 protein [Gemmatimonadaceae bacterium]